MQHFPVGCIEAAFVAAACSETCEPRLAPGMCAAQTRRASELDVPSRWHELTPLEVLALLESMDLFCLWQNRRLWAIFEKLNKEFRLVPDRTQACHKDNAPKRICINYPGREQQEKVRLQQR